MTDRFTLTEDLDPETVDAIMEGMEETCQEAEGVLNSLKGSAGDAEMLHGMFRRIHTVKGNAAMAQVRGLVDYVHAVEEVISALRERRYPCSVPVAEALLLGTDRIRDLHYAVFRGDGEIEPDQVATLEDAFKRLARSGRDDADRVGGEIIGLISGKLVEVESASPEAQADSAHWADLGLDEQQTADLDYFRQLALRVDEKTVFWAGRSDLICRLALHMNAAAGKPVDPAQLAAGAYLHDVGMAFLPDELVNKSGRLNALQLKQLQSHPVLAWELARRMPGWDEAARIVLHHQERCDGAGYPSGLRGDDIAPGAQIIAILDAYYAMTHQRADRPHKRSVLRAVTEINARKGTQFSSEWVPAFNNVIRELARAGEF